MDVKELRIGNYVMSKHGLITQIERGDFEYHSGLANLEDNLPIPLTEEWLLKFGFEKSIENAGNLPCYKKGKYTIAKWIGGKYQFWINTVDIYNSPQYLHQLQNLYFALTGEELEIK